MNLTLLFTILGFLVAVYALIPPERKLDLKLRMNWFDWFIALSAAIIIHYILLFPVLKNLGGTLDLGTWRWGFNADNTTYLIILVTTIFLILRIQYAPLRRTKIEAFRDLINRLFQEQKYSDVLSILRSHHKNLFRIYHADFFLPNLHKKMAPKLIIIWKALQAESEKPEKIGVLKKIKSKASSLKSTIASWLPTGEKHSKIAEDVVKRILTAEEFLDYIARVDPYFALTLLNYDFREKEEFLELYIRQLLNQRSGTLYFEIKNNQILANGKRYKIDERNRFIDYFLKDAAIAEKLAIWSPFGEYAINFLEKLNQTPASDKYNESIGNYHDEERWRCPIHITLRFFDLMVLEALYQGIQWHMWLYYWPIITDKLIENISPKANVDLMSEWPTPYHCLLYEIVAALADWIEAVEHIPTDQENTKIATEDIEHENGNIPKSAIIALSHILYSCLKTDALELKFKGYLLDIVLRTIRNLKTKEHTKPFARILQEAIKQGGPTHYNKADNYSSLLDEALSRVDHLLRNELEKE